MAKFFIHRPIFAWVIALIIMFAGILTLKNMPVAQYPKIAAPQIQINAVYAGASADTVEKTVTQIIEQQMTGLDGMRYIEGNSTNGSSQLTVYFQQGTDPDMAQVQVQNKLQSATPLLPQDVQRRGITVSKGNPSFLQVLAFYSEDGSMSDADIKDYVASNISEQLSRVEGVGSVRVFGGSYAMRIWLDPAKLANFNLTPLDVSNAISAQNTQVAVGQIGALPSREGQAINATVTAQSLLQTPEQFRNIILKNSQNGSIVRLSDVARVELGSDSYDVVSKYNGKPAGGLAVSLATGANALETAKRVEKVLNNLRKNYPTGLKDEVAYDTTPFVERSISAVVKTLIEAVILVFLVMFLFLQNWRATIIPTFAVPVVVLGTFAVINLFGFSINTLTMFAMVLAIGLLVDDAIVVVENVERIMVEEHLDPVTATEKSMGQISGALVGITSVLSAVFIPLSFMGGTSGVIYRQFSITLIVAMLLSLLIAIVFTPALCATMLKQHDPNKKPSNNPIAKFFHGFNRAFDATASLYQRSVGKMISKMGRWVSVAIFVVFCGILGFLGKSLPSSFLPTEDQGMIMTLIQLPVNSSMERTEKVVDQVADYYMNKEKDMVESVFSVSGFSFGGGGQNQGMAFVRLKDWEQRTTPELQSPALVQRAMSLNAIPEAELVFPMQLPAMLELGNSTGVQFVLKDVNANGPEKLDLASKEILKMISQDKRFVFSHSTSQDTAPQYKVIIDQEKAGSMGVSLSDINRTMGIAWAGSYVNDFIDRGRVKKVYVQSDTDGRMMPEDLNKWYVRNSSGEMIPFSAFATGHWEHGSLGLKRYNGSSSITLEAVGMMSTGETMKTIEGFADKLPELGFNGFAYEWTGLSLEEQEAGSQKMIVFALAGLMVFLILAALYESWSVPFSVMLSIPIGVLGSFILTFAVMIITKDFQNVGNNIYFTVAIVAVIGLAAKNAILIVEFAKELQEQGEDLIKATLHASKMRLRPIIMTTLAFGFGVLPLAIASGAGAAAQHSVGYGVLGGVLSSTVLGIFFIPVFFVIVRSIFKYKAKPQQEKHL
ncbi:efflux RND transporter permease subunit [Moraxella sp. ZY210820]|uniref:efflux RND transporter permease subunit n=1 Tax=unclassified Moraxella TaxID=2685852 RepID=UPI00273147B0|nr:efflux RND transporter permease subunit [Moraxella sp. ZY210820]WLF82959.1 efflux RND transporter permease subunit [Moraxella sp. ZY210820]